MSVILKFKNRYGRDCYVIQKSETNADANSPVVFASDNYWEVEAEYSRLMTEAGFVNTSKTNAVSYQHPDDMRVSSRRLEAAGITVADEIAYAAYLRANQDFARDELQTIYEFTGKDEQ